ncbi:MAG: hypothetical protein AAGC46_04460, partial [Solirubrobacteraceae bacterium]|nr:hypothetical protein [Patulibacter sp.]
MPLFPRPTVAALAALTACAVVAPAAHAAPYEQISRATGVAGATQLIAPLQPLFASNTGLIAASTTIVNPDDAYSTQATGLRNTITNTTTIPHADA